MNSNPVVEALLEYRSLITELEKERDYWKAKAQANWDILESVATGEKLQCAKCGHNHPCRCDDGS